jgi:hypothetical protein
MRFFRASRLRGASIFALWRCRPRGSFVADFFLAYVPDPRLDCYRDLTGTVKIPVTLVGFTWYPSQFCFRPRVTASFDDSHPPAVSPRAAASFIVAESTACDGGP